MSGGKGGSQTTAVEVPQALSDAARRNLARADKIAGIGYMPYFGADVAAMTPMQQAAMQGTNQMASAFGLPSVSNPMAGMPQSQDFGGMQAYSSAPLFEQSLQSLAQNRPEQYQAIESMFNPTGGTSYGGGYGGGYGSGGGYGTTNSGGGVSASDVAGTALGAYGAYKAIPAVASKVGGLLGGTSGIGALPTLSQLGAVAPYLGAPFLLDPIGKHVISPIADSLGFGSKEREARQAATDQINESGVGAMIDAQNAAFGGTTRERIAAKTPPRNPYQMATDYLDDTDEGRMEAEQLSNFYSNTPEGQRQMQSFWAANPEFFTPTGDRVFAEGRLGDIDREMASYYGTTINPQTGVGVNPMNKYLQMSKAGNLFDYLEGNI